MHHFRYTARALVAATLLAGLATSAKATEISMLRFFGECQTDYGNVTDPSKANGECGIITALTNKFNAENKLGVKVVAQTVDWAAYYDQLTATYSTGNIPDVAVMHASVLPDFASRKLLTPLSEGLTEAGVDMQDFVPAALKNATSDGTVYALPFDLHSLLFHVNVDLMKEAGFVNPDGSVRLPRTPDELLSMGKEFKAKTGKFFIATESQSSEGMMVRFWESLMWQQGVDVIAADGKSASIDTPEGLKAAELIKSMYSEGIANTALDYPGAQQAFLNGDAAITVNGTWVVDTFDSQAKSGAAALKNYKVFTVPPIFGTEKVWADSHLWVMPKNDNRTPEKVKATLAFMKFLYDNNLQWTRTGHLSVRKSIIDSPEFAALPHRQEYAAMTNQATSLPQVKSQRAIFNAMITDFNAMWLTSTEASDALAAMQDSVDQILRRNR